MVEVVSHLFLGTREDAEALGAEVPPSWSCISVTEHRAAYGREEELPREPRGAIDLPFMLVDGALRERALDEIAETIAAALDSGRRVLVHCVKADERSPLAIAWYLAWAGIASWPYTAYGVVRDLHHSTEVRSGWVRGLIPGRGREMRRVRVR